MVDSEYSLAMLKHIFSMYNDIKTSTLKVEFILHYHVCVQSPKTNKLEYMFMKYFMVWAAESGCTHCTDEMISTLFQNFIDMDSECRMRKMEAKNPDANENPDDSLENADRVFITFVRMFLRAAIKMGVLEEWSSEKIACTVLECMNNYYAHPREWKQEPAEYFLGCMVKVL